MVIISVWFKSKSNLQILWNSGFQLTFTEVHPLILFQQRSKEYAGEDLRKVDKQ